jgi:hypothetical protein
MFDLTRVLCFDKVYPLSAVTHINQLAHLAMLGYWYVLRWQKISKKKLKY